MEVGFIRASIPFLHGRASVVKKCLVALVHHPPFFERIPNAAHIPRARAAQNDTHPLFPLQKPSEGDNTHG